MAERLHSNHEKNKKWNTVPLIVKSSKPHQIIKSCNNKKYCPYLNITSDRHMRHVAVELV